MSAISFTNQVDDPINLFWCNPHIISKKCEPKILFYLGSLIF